MRLRHNTSECMWMISLCCAGMHALLRALCVCVCVSMCMCVLCYHVLMRSASTTRIMRIMIIELERERERESDRDRDRQSDVVTQSRLEDAQEQHEERKAATCATSGSSTCASHQVFVLITLHRCRCVYVCVGIIATLHTTACATLHTAHACISIASRVT